MNSLYMPSISVIVATYQRPKTILRLLDILNHQVRFKLDDLEVCIVDDGSSESLEGKLEEYLFKFQYIYRDRAPDNTARVYSSRNMAANVTTGDMILQLDDDVTFHER